MTIIVSDTFTEAVSQVLTSHTPDIGSPWTLEEDTTSGGSNIQAASASDQARCSATTASSRILYSSNPDPTSASYDVQLTWVTVPTGSDDPTWLFARMTDTQNYYFAGSYQGGAAADKKIFKIVSNSKTELASGDSGAADNDVLKFQIRTATKKLFKNGVEQLSTSDDVLTSAGRCGIALGNLGSSSTDDVNGSWAGDDYSVDEISTGSMALPPLPARMLSVMAR